MRVFKNVIIWTKLLIRDAKKYVRMTKFDQ